MQWRTKINISFYEWHNIFITGCVWNDKQFSLENKQPIIKQIAKPVEVSNNKCTEGRMNFCTDPNLKQTEADCQGDNI